MMTLEIYKDNNLIVRTVANSCYELNLKEHIGLCEVYRRKYPFKEIKLVLTYDPL